MIMGSDAFIRAFKRFVSRRGTPKLVIHDNFKTFRSKAVTRFMSQRMIYQQFILPASPWWGGFYERLVRSVKTTLKKSLKKSFLTFEEMQTVLCETESVINSRPLCYIGEDDLDNVITPNHLIFGRDISQPYLSTNVQQRIPETTIDITKRQRHFYKVSASIWKSFSETYLNELRQSHIYRKQKYKENPSLRLNDVVLIKDDTPVPRQNWRIGRVHKIIVGKDGKQRGAEIVTHSNQGKKTTIRRPLQKIIPFEIADHTNGHEPEIEPETVINDTQHDTARTESKRISRKTAIEGQILRRLRNKYYS